MAEYFHSIRLEEDKCKGCTNCIKKCPTGAIRVRNGKAKIIANRCIDCGECVRVCPYRAKRAVTDTLDRFEEFKYKIALPAPSLYAQFSKEYTRGQILAALRMMGFDYVYEVARAAELVTAETKKYLARKDIEKPVISSACPVVVRFIALKYPNLIDNVLPIEAPMEIAAQIAKEEYTRKYNKNPKDVGVFFISPCAAKRTAVRSPLGSEKSSIDCVISIKSVYFALRRLLEEAKEVDFDIMASKYGVRWANNGGESLALENDNFIAVDGIHNVAKVLEEIENERIQDIDFVEALACMGGCLGGLLCMENVYTAKTVLKKILEKDVTQLAEPQKDEHYDPVLHNKIKDVDAYSFDKDMNKAMMKMNEMTKIIERLPGLDCGACGSPNCITFAEDIVRGFANEADCIVNLKENYKSLLKMMMTKEEE